MVYPLDSVPNPNPKTISERSSLSINALRARVYIRAPTLWFIDVTVAIAIFKTLFWVYADFFHEKMDTTRKYSKSGIFVQYENGRRRLLGAQSINTERASDCCASKHDLLGFLLVVVLICYQERWQQTWWTTSWRQRSTGRRESSRHQLGRNFHPSSVAQLANI